MSIGIIELNDAGLRVGSLDQPQELLHQSPGLAVLESSGNLLLGAGAMAQTRLHPLQSNNIFWHRLSTEPLSFQSASYRHHADLAYSQLLALHQFIPQSERIIFALPATYTREQMALLLGIVDQCPFRAVSLVDSAVAAAVPHVQRRKSIHLDIQLHQCVLTEMELVEGQLAGQRVEVMSGLGLQAMWERWAKAIADQFIDQCRFDPLHSAPSEQSLYDQLPRWMSAYGDSDELFMEVSGKSIKLSRAAFIAAVKPLYEQIGKRLQSLSSDCQLLVSDRLTGLPGLVDLLSQHNSFVTRLTATAVMEGIHQHAERLVQTEGPLRFTRQLAAGEISDNETPSTTTNQSPQPSRSQGSLCLLIGHTAYPLDEVLYVNLQQGCVTDAANADASLQRQDEGVLFTPMGPAPISDARLLQPGDSVGAMTLIEVLQGHGTQ